jgi:hypothetical protein
MLLLLPVVRRVERGEAAETEVGAEGGAGAGCGLSRGFRLVNLYDPYATPLGGCAAATGESWVPGTLGALVTLGALGMLGTLWVLWLL